MLPAPALPAGYNHWQAQGYKWTSPDAISIHAMKHIDSKEWTVFQGRTLASDNTFYLTAVKTESEPLPG